MFDRILVGVDGGAGGRDAVALARELLAPGGQLVLANVSLDVRAASELLDGIAAELALGADVALDPLLDDDPSLGLARHVQDRGLDAIVVGSSHRGGIARALLGDDSRALLHRAPCPVAVAPREYAYDEHVIETIGVAYDGTPEAERALEAAAGAGRRARARVHVLTVVPSSEARSREERLRMEDLLPRVVRRVAPEAESEIVVSAPRAEIIRLSRRVDLLWLGARELHTVDRLLGGSTSDVIAREAACPVVIVPWHAAIPERLRVRPPAPAPVNEAPAPAA